MNTLEKNKLIAEFMGNELRGLDKDIYFNNDHNFPCQHSILADELQYSGSWDWLMPVIDEISESAHNDMATSEKLQNGSYLVWDNGDLHICISTIDSIYEEVVSFIEWYNIQNT